MFNGGRIVNADEVANMLRLGECSEGTQIPINKDILLPYWDIRLVLNVNGLFHPYISWLFLSDK